MNAFLAFVGQLFLRAAMWCYKNPAKVDYGINEFRKLVDKVHAARMLRQPGVIPVGQNRG